jgi:hypothetical protein
MQRRGQCKCGEVLTFERGPDGYKRRCPRCAAVVRLRVDDTVGLSSLPTDESGPPRPPRPADPRLSVAALRAPGPAVPGGPDPDATAPFEPVHEVELEPWTPPPAAPPSTPSPGRQRLIVAVVAGILLAAVVAAALWWRLS